MKMLLLSILAPSLLLMACNSGSSAKPKENLPYNEPEILVGDEPMTAEEAREYYSRFLTRTSGQCPETLSFSFLTNADELILRQDDDVLLATFKVALIDDKTFYLRYEEILVTGDFFSLGKTKSKIV